MNIVKIVCVLGSIGIVTIGSGLLILDKELERLKTRVEIQGLLNECQLKILEQLNEEVYELQKSKDL